MIVWHLFGVVYNRHIVCHRTERLGRYGILLVGIDYSLFVSSTICYSLSSYPHQWSSWRFSFDRYFRQSINSVFTLSWSISSGLNRPPLDRYSVILSTSLSRDNSGSLWRV